jgi:hypothetical protein
MATVATTPTTEVGLTDSGHEEVSPPDFNEEWPMPQDGSRRASRGRGSAGTSEFPDVGERSIPHVSPMTAHVFSYHDAANVKYHFAILRFFCALLDAIEATESDAKSKAKRVQQFLVCAEARYIRYLALLDEFAYDFTGNDLEAPFSQMMPLPPW